MANSGNSVELGAVGGSNGLPWSFEIEGGGITKIIIGSGWALDSIRVVGQTANGSVVESTRFGGSGGSSSEIILDWPREYVTSISGTHNNYFTEYAIKGINFTTNLGKTYTFGYGDVKDDDTPFSLTINRGAVVGFHGRSGQYINAIGVYVRPTYEPKP